MLGSRGGRSCDGGLRRCAIARLRDFSAALLNQVLRVRSSFVCSIARSARPDGRRARKIVLKLPSEFKLSNNYRSGSRSASRTGASCKLDEGAKNEHSRPIVFSSARSLALLGAIATHSTLASQRTWPKNADMRTLMVCMKASKKDKSSRFHSIDIQVHDGLGLASIIAIRQLVIQVAHLLIHSLVARSLSQPVSQSVSQ